MNRVATLIYFSFRLFFFRGKGKTTRPLLGAILGISLSLIPLVIVIQVSGGMINGITERYLETLSYHLQVRPYSYQTMEELDRYSEKLKTLDFVRNSTIEKQGLGILYSPEGKSGVTIRAVEEDFYKADRGVEKYIKLEEGHFDLSTINSVVVGRSIARRLKLSAGDEIKLLTGKFFSNGKFLPKISTYVIKGIFSTGYEELDKMWLFIPLSVGQKILAESSSQTIMGIKIHEPYDGLKEARSSLLRILPKRWPVYTWESINKSQQEEYQTVKKLLIFIMSLIVCVAVINISSSLIMLVLEKKVELSVLKCLGASPFNIGLFYVLTGIFTGMMGAFLGLTAGLVISVNINSMIFRIEQVINYIITGVSVLLSPFVDVSKGSLQLLNSSYYLEEIPVTIEAGQIVLIFFLTVILAAVSSSVPALKAGKIRPMEILRKH